MLTMSKATFMALPDKLVSKEAALGVVHHIQPLAVMALEAAIVSLPPAEKVAVLCAEGTKMWSSWAVSVQKSVLEQSRSAAATQAILAMARPHHQAQKGGYQSGPD